VGLAGRPGRRGAWLGGRPAHPGQGPDADGGHQRLVIAAAWLLGYFVGVRRDHIARLEQTAELERARAEQARRAVAEERLRLARELHDVVAHSISVIAVQSGVGAHVATTQPEEAAKALATIEATSRAARIELRRLLGVLRQEGEPEGSLAPVPGLADLDALLAELAKAGLGCGCGWRGRDRRC
jgi:signal transduction histidine kinase